MACGRFNRRIDDFDCEIDLIANLLADGTDVLGNSGARQELLMQLACPSRR